MGLLKTVVRNASCYLYMYFACLCNVTLRGVSALLTRKCLPFLHRTPSNLEFRTVQSFFRGCVACFSTHPFLSFRTP